MRGLPTPILWGRPVAQIGLDLFFCVSGYLIYDSWLRDEHPGRFLTRRALRILPGLAVCVLFCIVVVGAVATTLPLRRYFTHHGTWQFLLNVALYLKLYLPGVFTQRRLGGAVDGSLWSLFPEVLCYLAIPVLALTSLRFRGAALLALMAACGGAAIWLFAFHPVMLPLIYSADPKYVLAEVPFFMAGAFWRHLQLRYPGAIRLDLALLCCAATFSLPATIGTDSVPLRWLTLSYAVIGFCLASTPILRHAMRLGDLSYGAYLYAFPVQQLTLNHIDSVALPTAATFGIAYLSWHLVEAPCLRWKPRQPRRTGAAQPATPQAQWIDWPRAGWTLATRTPALPVAAALACLALFAAHLAEARWAANDYILVGALRVRDWATALPMLATDPVRGALVACYGLAAAAARMSGLVTALAVLWAAALGLACAAAWKAAARRRPVLAAGLGLAPFAFAMARAGALDSPTSAAGVLPAAAALTAIWFTAGCVRPAARGALLAFAACSSAAGAGLALCSLLGVTRHRSWRSRKALYLSIPAVLGGAVLLFTLPSGGADLTPLLLAQSGWIILFAVGFSLTATLSGIPVLAPREGLLLAAGMAAAAGAGAYAGEPALCLLAIALALGALLRVLWTAQAAWAPALLAVSLYPATQAWPGSNPQDAHFAVAARSNTWASARRPGKAMEFFLSPGQSTLFGLPPGTYIDAPALVPVARVFGRTEITVCQPWQQSDSWLIDGRFIPACPPHGGPPDHVLNTGADAGVVR